MKPTLAAPVLVSLLALLAPGPALARGWIWPVEGEVITQYRNGDDPYAAGQHRGIDIAAPVGAPVVATVAGTVTFAGAAGSSGLTVAVRAQGAALDTSYLHLSRVAVAAGERVDAGDPLGSVGTSGRRSVERPHLHFGVREAGRRHGYLDPLDFLGEPPSQSEPRRPAPEPAPVPVGPRPGPASAPREPQPTRVPDAAPAPVTHPVPTPLPVAAPRPAADPFARPAPASPARAPGHGPFRAPATPHGHAPAPFAPGRAPEGPRLAEPGPSGEHPGAGPLGPGAAAMPARPAALRRDSGVDRGWLAACAGLLLASAALGRAATRSPRSGRPRGRTEVRRAAAPLSGAARS